MNTTDFTCTNCGAGSSGAFCASCGQKKFQRKQFELRHAVREIFSEVSDLESSLGKTIRALVTQPGRLTADYLTGRQKCYVAPVKLYLIIITANFLLYAIMEDYSFMNVALLKNMVQDVDWLHELVVVARQRSVMSDEAFYHEVNVRVNDTLPVLLYFLIFAQALVLKVQFIKHQRYYIEHLVFALHFMSFGFLRDMVLLPIQFLNTSIAFALSIITAVCYLWLSLKNAYQLRGIALLGHTLLHYFIFFLLFALTIFISVYVGLQSVA